jgi:hypothetical protein
MVLLRLLQVAGVDDHELPGWRYLFATRSTSATVTVFSFARRASTNSVVHVCDASMFVTNPSFDRLVSWPLIQSSFARWSSSPPAGLSPPQRDEVTVWIANLRREASALRARFG